MALDQPGTLNHSIPAIVFLVLCPVVLTMVIIYYLVTYCVRKNRQRRKEERDSANASASTTSITSEAPRRELHRWIPTLSTTPEHLAVPNSSRARDSASGDSFRTRSLVLSPTPSSEHRYSLAYSLPISELDMLPTSDVATTLTPPAPAVLNRHVTGHVSSLPHNDQDPFADPKPSYLRGAESDANDAMSHAHGSPVAVPAPAPSVHSSVDGVSISTSSTLPPSYRTHRPTHRTASEAQFSGHGRRREAVGMQPAAESYGPTSYQPQSARRSRYYPRKSVDGGVRLEGGPVDPATWQGPEMPPRYRKQQKL